VRERERVIGKGNIKKSTPAARINDPCQLCAESKYITISK